jgi:hypothetical protein
LYFLNQAKYILQKFPDAISRKNLSSAKTTYMILAFRENFAESKKKRRKTSHISSAADPNPAPF